MRGRARRGRFTLDGAPGGLFPKAPDFWDRAHAALAERLLAPPRPPGAELYDFVHGEDAELNTGARTYFPCKATANSDPSTAKYLELEIFLSGAQVENHRKTLPGLLKQFTAFAQKELRCE
ncbi:hypothetical protein ACH4KT_11180 [Streptomyces anulatus]